MQVQEKKYFGGSGGSGDFDSADFAVAPNSWINAENIRTRTTDNGYTETVEAIGSTILRSVIQPSVTHIRLGSAEDTANNRFVTFLKDIYGTEDKIMCYDLFSKTEYIVLLSSQVTDGLGFDKDYPIHSARVIDGVVYWVQGNNDPRRINIDSGIKLNHPSYSTSATAYEDPLAQSVIRIIRNPPAYPLTVNKEYDSSTQTNFTQNEAFLFAYSYTYRGFEQSVLSPFSRLINYNYSTDNFNSVSLTVPFNEYIEQDVLRVEFAAYYLNGNKAFSIKTWDKNVAADAAEIAAHNAETTALTYTFYNDVIGNTLASDYVSKQYDSVPIISQTLETVKDRLHLANNLVGYNAPTQSSLTVEVVESTGTGVTKIAYDCQLTFRSPDGLDFNYVRVWLLFLTEVSPMGFYAVTSTEQNNPSAVAMPAALPLPATVVLANLSFRGTGRDDTIFYYRAGYPTYIPQGALFPQPGDSTEITDIPPSATVPFKDDSSYQVGIQFYDYALRKCGVFTDASTIVKIDQRDFDLTTITTSINWALSNSTPLLEIPEFAHYYSIVLSKNLTTRFFMQAVTNEILYARKNADGTYDINTSYHTIASNSTNLAISLEYLATYGYGYTFAENDIVKIYEDPSTSYSVRVIGVDGKYLITQLVDIGDTTGDEYVYEIRTPYQRLSNEPLYENGNMYAITNAGTSSREYSTLSGSLSGDVYIFTRTHSAVNYFTEAMSPQDNQWQIWNTDSGRPCFVDKIGQTLKSSYGAYSNTILQGSEINGLSTFDSLNQYNLPQEAGEVQKLQVTSKVQNEMGIIMLAICKWETASLYMGEVQQYGSNQQTNLTISESVVGTINVLKGNYGTVNPESVVEFRGNVFWYDANNGKIIQYSSNGLFPISNYKMTRYWKQFSDQYNSMTKAEVEALGSRPFVYMAVDPHHYELLVTVPKVLSTPPKGYLPDYPSTIYPFDIWDGQAKTLVFKLNSEPNYWQGSYSFTPEGMITMQNKLFLFKYGQLYEANSEDSLCEFFGIQHKPKIMFVANQDKAIPKTYNNFSVNGNLKPSFVYFRSEVPYEQASDLEDFSFTTLEGNYYAVILRNKLIPTQAGLDTTGLLTGEKMTTITLKILMQWNVTNQNINLNFISIGYQPSAGHINFKRQ